MNLLPASSQPGWARLALVSCAALPAALCSLPAHSETLEAAWQQALGHHPTLAAARATADAAERSLDAAEAARWPALKLESGYTALAQTPAMQAEVLGNAVQLPVGQTRSARTKAVATLPLYTAGRIEQGVAAAEAGVAWSHTQVQQQQQALKLQVAEAFVNVLRAEQAQTLAEQHVARLEVHRQDAHQLRTQGMASRNEVLAAEVNLAQGRQAALQSRHALDLARASYNQRLQRPLEQAVTLDEPAWADADPEPLPALTERALGQRPELQALARQLEAARAQSQAVRAESGPQLALSGGYDYQQNRYQVHPGQWFMGVGLSWQAWDGGAGRARAQGVEAQASALVAQREELDSQVRLQLRQAWLGVQDAHQRLQALQPATAQAEENLRVVQDRYRQGLATHSEVLDAETLRASTLLQVSHARFDVLLARWQLRHAAGEL